MANSPEFTSWRKMKERCCNPKAHNYAFYGGRGIKVCERWLHSYAAFLEDMGPKPSKKHSLERKDNNGHYCPENCVWASVKDQANNRRSTKMVAIHGQVKRLIDWSTFAGIPMRVIHHRLRLGWDPARAVFAPLREGHKPGRSDEIVSTIRAERLSPEQVAERFSVNLHTAKKYVRRAKSPP